MSKREFLEGLCMVLFLISLLLIEVSFPLALILVIIFGGLILLFESGSI